MKTEVYSWRVSADMKADLERQARIRKVSVSSILDEAAREWLNKQARKDVEDEAEQRRIRAAAERCLGILDGGNPRRAENARELIRERLRQKRAR